MGLVNCEDCGKQMASNARVCPYCGRKRTHPFVIGCAIILGIILFLFMYGSTSNMPMAPRAWGK